MTDPMHECISQNTNFSLYSAFDIVASLIEAVFDSENFGMHKTLKKTSIQFQWSVVQVQRRKNTFNPLQNKF